MAQWETNLKTSISHWNIFVDFLFTFFLPWNKNAYCRFLITLMLRICSMAKKDEWWTFILRREWWILDVYYRRWIQHMNAARGDIFQRRWVNLKMWLWQMLPLGIGRHFSTKMNGLRYMIVTKIHWEIWEIPTNHHGWNFQHRRMNLKMWLWQSFL